MAGRDPGAKLLHPARRVCGRRAGVSRALECRPVRSTNAQIADDEGVVDVQDVLLPVCIAPYPRDRDRHPRSARSRADARFYELFGGQQATDRVRGQRIPNTGIQLDTLGESSRPLSSNAVSLTHRRGVHVRELDCANLPGQEGRPAWPRSQGRQCLQQWQEVGPSKVGAHLIK